MAIKRRRIVKNRKPMTAKDIRIKDKAILYNDVKKLSTKVNKRLKSLEMSGHKTGTWASRKLVDRLSGSKLRAMTRTKKGRKRVKIKSGLTNTQLKTIQKSLNNFLKSETSTHKGIKNVREKTIESLKNTLSDDVHEMTYEEAEVLYDMFGNKDFDYFVDKVGASEMWIHIEEAIENNDSLSDFLTRLQMYAVELNDDDALERAERIYEKYVI